MSGPALRVFGLTSDSIVDGPGLRLSVFTQGCPHGCPGCHNPSSHDPAGGYDVPAEDIAQMAARNPLLSGITLTGGEPLEQAAACLALVRALPAGLSIWVYSGYTFEEIMAAGGDRAALLAACDVLVDGRFREGERSLDLLYCGSANQRLIDLRKTFAEGRPVLWEASVW